MMENSTAQGVVRDNMLQVLVKMANHTSFIAVPVTILSHGFLISGTIASGKEYFDWMTSQLSAPFTEADTREVIKTAMDKWADNLYGSEDSDETLKRETVYIHLKDAKLFHPSGNEIPANNSVWWRGRIEEVSGFTIGNLNTEIR